MKTLLTIILFATSTLAMAWTGPQFEQQMQQIQRDSDQGYQRIQQQNIQDQQFRQQLQIQQLQNQQEQQGQNRTIQLRQNRRTGGNPMFMLRD